MLSTVSFNLIQPLMQQSEDDVRIPILEGIANYFTSGKFLRTVIVILIFIGIWLILKLISRSRVAKLGKSSVVERNVHIMMNIVKVVLVFFMLIIVLQVNGVNVTSLVAGLGIVSVIVGFAFQDLLSDWINGITIVTERFFNVGDVITVGDVTGRVVKMNLKVTKIEDIHTNSIVTMDNRLLSQAILVSPNLNFLFPIPYDSKVDETDEFIEGIVNEIRQIDGVKWAENKGLQTFDDSKLTYLIRIVMDDAFKKLIITRAANNIVRVKYEEKGWSIPYNQLDVHIKEN